MMKIKKAICSSLILPLLSTHLQRALKIAPRERVFSAVGCCNQSSRGVGKDKYLKEWRRCRRQTPGWCAGAGCGRCCWWQRRWRQRAARPWGTAWLSSPSLPGREEERFSAKLIACVLKLLEEEATSTGHEIRVSKAFPRGQWWSYSAERPRRQQIGLLKLAPHSLKPSRRRPLTTLQMARKYY